MHNILILISSSAIDATVKRIRAVNRRRYVAKRDTGAAAAKLISYDE